MEYRFFKSLQSQPISVVPRGLALHLIAHKSDANVHVYADVFKLRSEAISKRMAYLISPQTKSALKSRMFHLDSALSKYKPCVTHPWVHLGYIWGYIDFIGVIRSMSR